MPSGHGLLRETSTTASGLPIFTTIQHHSRQLHTAVPQCAQACFSSQLKKYNCQDNDLSCLCSNYSSDGFALGELAFICLQEQCANVTDSEEITAYNVCSAEPSHVTATHTILTISTTNPSITAAASGTSLHTTTVSSTTSSTAAQFPSSSATSSVTTTTSSTPTTMIEPEAPSHTAGGSSLNTGQAVGVSFACIGGLLLAISLVYLCTYLRRRKLQRQAEDRHSYDFVDEAPPRFMPYSASRFDGRGPFAEHTAPQAELPSEKHNTYWPGQNIYSHHPPPEPYYGNEKSADPDPHAFYGSSPDSHISNSSQRTTSQLLPERPERTYVRPTANSPYRGVVATPPTVFEEAAPKMSGALPIGLPGKAIKGKNHRPPPRHPQYAPEYTRSPESMKQPSLSLEIPKRPPRSDTIQIVTNPSAIKRPASQESEPETAKPRPITVFRIPPPPPPLRIRTNSGEYPPRTSVHSKMSKTSRPESVLNYYTGVDGGSSKGESSSLYSTTPIEETQAPRPPPATITITKPTYPPRGCRMSTASDATHRTSFESTDPDEPTPPEEVERQLTPVRQSAEETSPIAGIRYPKIPRPSNQAIPRSPGHNGVYPSYHIAARHGRQADSSTSKPERQADAHGRTLSGSTLAAKRRGDTAAQDLENGLYIKDSSKSRSHSRGASTEEAKARMQWRQSQRNQSPLRGYGRNIQNEANWPLPPKQIVITRPSAPGPRQSDLWEPKLTPKREGGDLYLDVSAATPRYTTFDGRR